MRSRIASCNVKFPERNESERLIKDTIRQVFSVFEIEGNVNVFDIKECIFYKFVPPRHLTRNATLRFLKVDCKIFVYKAQI